MDTAQYARQRCRLQGISRGRGRVWNRVNRALSGIDGFSRGGDQFEVLRRDRIDQPDAIAGHEEIVTVADHGGGVDPQYRRTAMPGTDIHRGVDIRGQVHGMTPHGEQALVPDQAEGAFGGAVEQQRRWIGGGVAEIDLDRMALPGADRGTRFIEFEAPLIVLRHHRLELRTGETAVVCGGLAQQVLDPHPARRIRGQADGIRLMPEPTRQALGQSDQFLFIHVCPRSRIDGRGASGFGCQL